MVNHTAVAGLLDDSNKNVLMMLLLTVLFSFYA